MISVMVGADQVHARLDSAKIAKLQVQHADRGKEMLCICNVSIRMDASFDVFCLGPEEKS